MTIRLEPVSPVSLLNKIPRLATLLTRCDICGRQATAIQMVMVDFVCQKETMIPLTDQHLELVRHGQISVLHYPFRREGIFYRGRTARKNANTASLSANPVMKVYTLRTP